MSELKIEYVPLSQLKKHPRNPKAHRLDELNASVDRYGFTMPPAIDERSGLLCAEPGRIDLLTRMKAEGKAAPPGIEVDAAEWRVPVIRGLSFKDDSELDAYLIADNRLTELGGWLDDKLLEILKEQQSHGTLKGTGFDQAELERLLRESLPSKSEKTWPLFSKEMIEEETFKFYRARGFPYIDLPLHVCLQQLNALAEIQADATLRTTPLCGQVADTYHRHRLHLSAKGMKSPFDAFMDDKLFRKAIGEQLKWSDIGTDFFGYLLLVSGVQACGNFRPGFAVYIYRRFAEGKKVRVLDTSTGFGGRLLGAIASGCVTQYVGIDPNTKTYAANLKMAGELAKSMSFSLINQPAEDVDPESLARDPVDISFTSPPYFLKEIYSDEPTQSGVRYPEAEAWRDGFLKKMILLQFAALRPGGWNIINIEDISIGSKRYKLVDWTIEAAKEAGFNLEGREGFRVINRPTPENDMSLEKNEALLLFKKPSSRSKSKSKN